MRPVDKTLCAWTLLFIAIISASAQVSSQGVNTSLLKDAAQNIASGNLDRAENELQSILRIVPDDYQALNLIGIIRAQQQREEEAEQIFRQVISQKPDFASGHVNLGLLYVQMNRPGDAIPELQEALRLDPTRDDAASALVGVWREQARAAVSSGNPEKALSLLIPARKLTPADPEVQFDFGMVALRMSLLPDAIGAFQQTLKLRSNDPSALYGLGRAYMGLSKFNDARQQFAHYVEVRPEDATGHYALGMTLSALQHSQEARSEYAKSIAITPVQTESYFRLGLLDLDSKDLDSAAKNFHQVLDRDPKHAGALAALGCVELEKKQFEEAADLLQRAISSDDSLREAHYYLGLTYARMGRKAESDQQLEIATQLEHDETERQKVVFKILDPATVQGSDPPQK